MIMELGAGKLAYYANIMLGAFLVFYAQNYAVMYTISTSLHSSYDL